MRYFLILIFLIGAPLFASYSLKNEYQIDNYVVESLDIPRAFLHSKKFLQMKQKYAKYKHRYFFDTSKVQTFFIPDLIKIINVKGIPEVFLFMAMAESNFAAHARSSKQAVGIWQFMPATAKKYGLRIDKFVDERKDPYKATNAAIKYLKYLHRIFGKWYLAALAYNAGEGTLLKAIERAGTDDLMVLIDPKKRYLPKESREYLYKIVMLALMANDKEYRLSSELAYIFSRGEEYDVLPVKVKGAELLDYVAQKIRVKSHYIKELNPHIKRGFTPPDVKRYTIYIPKIKSQEFKERYRPSNKMEGFLVYKIRQKDSLYTIAHRFGLKVSLLKRFNNLKSNLIHPGRSLMIPISKKRRLSKKHRRIYKVKKGDSFIKIAKKFGVNVKKLKFWNDKKDNLLKIGEQLVILY